MRIAMIGAGYVGLVSGACFADFGHDVVCVDKDSRKITALKRGEIPIFEPGLPDLIRRNVDEARLSFSTTLHRKDTYAMLTSIYLYPRWTFSCFLQFFFLLIKIFFFLIKTKKKK